MICPKCGGTTNGVVLSFGIVKVSLVICKPCAKTFRHCDLVGHPNREAMNSWWHRLHVDNQIDPCESRQKAMQFLERKMESAPVGRVLIKKSVKQRMEAYLEKQQLHELLGEDYVP